VTALAILDLGYGNVESIRLAFARLGVDAARTADPAVVQSAERLVLPGVGAAGFAMDRLREGGLVDPLRQRTRPMLGICLGMQLLFEQLDEGDTAGLGLVPGRVRAMHPSEGAPVPHIGWSQLADCREGLGLGDGDYVYFAHGFACGDGAATAARVSYGGASMPAAIRTGPLWGAQFHPERSSSAGARFLEAFLSA
jgi:glutamine amidotransferase